MIGKGRVIEHDLFSIAQRLKEIDPNYFVYYCYKKMRFEVHNKSQCGNTLALVLPFNTLDARTIMHVNNTRIERLSILLKDMELRNKKLEEQEAKVLFDTKKELAKETMSVL